MFCQESVNGLFQNVLFNAYVHMHITHVICTVLGVAVMVVVVVVVVCVWCVCVYVSVLEGHYISNYFMILRYIVHVRVIWTYTVILFTKAISYLHFGIIWGLYYLKWVT